MIQKPSMALKTAFREWKGGLNMVVSMYLIQTGWKALLFHPLDEVYYHKYRGTSL